MLPKIVNRRNTTLEIANKLNSTTRRREKVEIIGKRRKNKLRLRMLHKDIWEKSRRIMKVELIRKQISEEAGVINVKKENMKSIKGIG